MFKKWDNDATGPCNWLSPQRCLSVKLNPVTTNCCIFYLLHHHQLHPQPHLQHLCSPQTHLPRVCPFQQRSSLMRSAAAFSSLQMVCGRDTQKPRMGLSLSFSSETCMEAERRYDSDLRLNYPCLLQLAARGTLMVQCWRWLKFLGQLLTFFIFFFINRP